MAIYTPYTANVDVRVNFIFRYFNTNLPVVFDVKKIKKCTKIYTEIKMSNEQVVVWLSQMRQQVFFIRSMRFNLSLIYERRSSDVIWMLALHNTMSRTISWLTFLSLSAVVCVHLQPLETVEPRKLLKPGKPFISNHQHLTTVNNNQEDQIPSFEIMDFYVPSFPSAGW